MNLPSFKFLQLIPPFDTTVSSPKLELITLTWDHIADRYLRKIQSNRILAGRLRSIRLLAVHDAIHSVIDPGNGYIYKEISAASSTDAAAAAAIRASHDIIAAVFKSPEDREDLAGLLEETLNLLPGQIEKSAGVTSGAESAATYLRAFAPLLQDHRVPERRLAAAQPSSRQTWDAGWRKSA